MNRTIIIFLLIIYNLNCYSQTQSELNKQALKDYQKTEKKLNEIIQKIIEEYKADTIFITKLNKSQKSWTIFRDNELEMKFPVNDKQLEYGTSYPLCSSLYLEKLTNQRIENLKIWLEGTKEGNICNGSVKNEISLIDSYIEKTKLNKNLTESITEGTIKYGKKFKKTGGFEYYEFFTENPKELYRIEYNSSTDDYLTENYYYKNNQLVFAESVIKKENGKIIKTKLYLKDDKVIYQMKSDYTNAETLIKSGKKYLTEFAKE